MPFFRAFVLCLTAALLFSCGAEAENSDQTEEREAPTLPVPEAPAPELLYAWVDALNLRAEPKTGSASVTKVNSGDALTYLGESTKATEKIELRGVVYDEPWMKVTAPDGKSGWVFGGAVKRAGETKGTEKQIKGVINIPHFGRYDLRVWAKETETMEEAGDAEVMTTLYSSGSWLMKITRTGVGEYGYGLTYRLIGPNNETLKVRDLVWASDAENGHELTEKVYDFEAEPAVMYVRSEVYEKHFMQLKYAPETVKGEFIATPMSPAEVEEALQMYRN
ncbi:SH3 domain-containing protein [Neolewinella agarilytica]|uniref:SH3 domain-containing protein n=1 Tax=Neolewinella agarilytica TaxID=478744 RepID=A0A1H9MDU0_9BACT|nr:SH3 domain-containing protein [Neolewinella agarilytica]SER21858.1 SH3 domain-containing protein [Neolewinella agarilytica]